MSKKKTISRDTIDIYAASLKNQFNLTLKKDHRKKRAKIIDRTVYLLLTNHLIKYNDIELLQIMADSELITEDDVIKEFKLNEKNRSYGGDVVSSVYILLTSVLAKNLSNCEDVEIHEKFTKYFFQKLKKSVLPKNIKINSNGSYNIKFDFNSNDKDYDKNLFCVYIYAAFSPMNENEIDSLYNTLCLYKTPPEYENYSCKKNIMKMLDMENDTIINRYLQKRTDELFDYIVKKCNIKETDLKQFSLEETFRLVCLLICPVAFISNKELNNDPLLKKALSLGIFKRNSNKDIPIISKDKNIITTLSKNTKPLIESNMLGALNRPVLNNNRYFSSLDAKHLFYNTQLTDLKLNQFVLESGIKCGYAVVSAIYEDLNDKITEAYYSETSENIDKSQIVRGLSYSDTDCRVIIEKINNNIYSLMYNAVIGEEVYLKILSLNYNNLKSCLISTSIWNEFVPGEKAQNITTITNNTISKQQKEIEMANLKVSELESKNRALQEEIEKLKSAQKKSGKLVETINDLKAYNQAIRDEADLRKHKERALRYHFREYEIEKYGASEENICQEAKTPDISDEFFADKRIIIVGGRWEVNDKLLELMPNSKVVYNKTEQMLNVKNYEAVLFFTDYTNHNVYGKYIKACRTHKTPVWYEKGSNLTLIKKDIYRLFTDTI